MRAWAIPAFTRSRRMSRSNSAKTASMPANALPLGVVRSIASLSETKPTWSAVSSWRVVTRSTRDRPSDPAARPGSVRVHAVAPPDQIFPLGRLRTPEPTSSTVMTMFHPRCSACSCMAESCKEASADRGWRRGHRGRRGAGPPLAKNPPSASLDTSLVLRGFGHAVTLWRKTIVWAMPLRQPKTQSQPSMLNKTS